MPPGQNSFGSLRSRKVDLKKPLPVLRYNECPDLDETASLNRAIPAVATGVEKEEEEVIQVEDCIGVPYCLDEVDDVFLEGYRKKCAESLEGLLPEDTLDDDMFEQLMYVLERAGVEKNQLVNDPLPYDEAVRFFSENEPLLVYSPRALTKVYEHWRQRRYTERAGANSIMPALKLDEIGPKPENDPYICFRRREIRPVRKAKRTDLSFLEKLKRLREEMYRARALVEMVAEREELKRDQFVYEKHIFEQRVLVRRLKKKLGVSTTEKDLEVNAEGGAGGNRVRRKKIKVVGSGDEARNLPSTKIKIPLQKFKEAGMAGVQPADQRAVSEAQTVLSEAAMIDAQIKKRKEKEEKEGWLDLTE
ncbi:Enhancer of polycomb-like protein 1, partial [Blyttiomyces sp. JEL0837]